MQIDVQELLDGFEAPAVFYRENTVRYFNHAAQTLFPELKSGQPMPDGFDAQDSPFRAEANRVPKGIVYLFRPKLGERSAGDLEAISRQLRASLAVVMAAEERVTPLLQERKEPEVDRMMEQVSRNLFLLRRLCDHIDLLRELEGRKPDVYREGPVDLVDLCHLLGEQIGDLTRQVGVRFRLECKEHTMMTTGDGVLLQRMLLNLISNAIKAAGAGGEIGLKLERKDDRAMLSVWDSGTGMEVDRLATVFRPQRRSGLPKPEDGVGIGLRLVREIAVLHGGMILAEARTGGGTKMTISIPLRTAKADHLKASTTWGMDLLSVVLAELADALPSQVYAHQNIDG